MRHMPGISMETTMCREHHVKMDKTILGLLLKPCELWKLSRCCSSSLLYSTCDRGINPLAVCYDIWLCNYSCKFVSPAYLSSQDILGTL